MVTEELQRAHLHPLAFPLELLESLSSLELALVQFHLANDEPGFDTVVRAARDIWLCRRARALDAGERVDGVFLPPSRPPPVLKELRSPAFESFVPLFTVLRKILAKDAAPTRAEVGSRLLEMFPEIYSGPYKAFKSYSLAARTMGIVELIPNSKGEHSGGMTRISLTNPVRPAPVPLLAVLTSWFVLQYKNLPLSPPSSPAPPLPKPPPPHPNLNPDNFHLAPLAFPVTPASLSSLPSHQLLLLQFRDDSSSGSASQEVERVFWRRRAAALEVGERWDFLPSVLPSRTTSAHSRPSAPGSGLPPLHDLLPPSVTNGFHTLEALYLPSQTVPTIPALLTLLPPHLSSTAAILYPPSPTPIPTSTYAPAPPIVARRAHFAFRSVGIAAAAQAHLNGLRLRVSSTDSAFFTVQAGAIPNDVKPRWCWGDVRPDEREALRREAYVSEAKRPREDAASADSRGVDKKPRLVVAPADPVPTHLLTSLFAAALTYKAIPRDLKVTGLCDDSFVWRFHAVAWATHDKTDNGTCLLFSSAKDRDAFGRWVFSDAQRYWKFNHLRARNLTVDDAARLGWRFRDFSPSWRRENGFSFAPSPTGDQPPTVGELGEGPDRPVGAPEHWLVGRFDFEYVQNGQCPPPVRGPAHFATRARTASAGSSLAARIGGPADDGPGSHRDDDRFTSMSPPPVSSGATSVMVSPRLEATGALAQRLSGPFEPLATCATPTLDLPAAPSPPPPPPSPPRSPAYAPPAPLPRLDTGLPAFASVLGAARLYPAPAPRGRERPARRVTACALWEFEEALDMAIDAGLEHLGAEVIEEDALVGDDEMGPGGRAGDTLEAPSATEELLVADAATTAGERVPMEVGEQPRSAALVAPIHLGADVPSSASTSADHSTQPAWEAPETAQPLTAEPMVNARTALTPASRPATSDVVASAVLQPTFPVAADMSLSFAATLGGSAFAFTRSPYISKSVVASTVPPAAPLLQRARPSSTPLLPDSPHPAAGSAIRGFSAPVSRRGTALQLDGAAALAFVDASSSSAPSRLPSRHPSRLPPNLSSHLSSSSNAPPLPSPTTSAAPASSPRHPALEGSVAHSPAKAPEPAAAPGFTELASLPRQSAFAIQFPGA
ncbi:hypothetical protein JCM3770_002259 [Rhodotorula araucariae]